MCCLLVLNSVTSSDRQFSSVGAGMVLGGGVLLFILGSNLGGVGQERGLRGGGRRGEARTILLFHIISARPQVAFVSGHQVEGNGGKTLSAA